MPFPPKKDDSKVPFFLKKDVKKGDKAGAADDKKEADKGSALRRLNGDNVKPKGKKGDKESKKEDANPKDETESGNDKYNKAKADLMAKVKGDGEKKPNPFAKKNDQGKDKEVKDDKGSSY